MWRRDNRLVRHLRARRRTRITTELEAELIREYPDLVARIRRRRGHRLRWRRGSILRAFYLVAAFTVMMSVGLYMPDAHSAPESGEYRERLYQELHQVQAGSLLFRTPQGHFRSAMRLDTDVDMRISGMVVRASVRQTFRNDGSEWAEGVYVFPLPEKAAVNTLKMHIGERTIIGEIKPRDLARRTYQQAKAAGQRASLVEQERPNIFTTSVANIPPGESIAVEIGYLQTLDYDQGEFELRFPLTLTPRFIPGRPVGHDEQPLAVEGGSGWALPTDQVPDASRITPAILVPGPEGSRSHFPKATLNVTLQAGFPLKELVSDSHTIVIEEDHPLQRIELQAGSTVMDHDFTLRWTPDIGHQPQAALFTEQVGNKHYALMMVMPPQRVTREIRLPREAIFILDTSGSMGGASIRQAKAALETALSRLQPQDRFNIVEFNSHARRLYAAPVKASHARIREALASVHALKANGGTNMAPAIGMALEGLPPRGYLRQVIFITDGAVGNERALFELVRQRLGDARLFTIGIGAAPNSFFMREAAIAGRGTFTHIGSVAEVQSKLGRLFEKLENPVLAQIQLKWPDDVQAESWPDVQPDLYMGEPVVVSVELDKVKGDLLIGGVTGRRPWQRSLALKQQQQSPGIAALWAREKIRHLMRKLERAQDKESIKKEIVEVALEHHLVSRYTSLVAVDSERVRPADRSLARKDIASPLPKGSTMHKVSLPATATDAELRFWAGILLLIPAVLIYGMRRRRCAH